MYRFSKEYKSGVLALTQPHEELESRLALLRRISVV